MLINQEDLLRAHNCLFFCPLFHKMHWMQWNEWMNRLFFLHCTIPKLHAINWQKRKKKNLKTNFHGIFSIQQKKIANSVNKKRSRLKTRLILCLSLYHLVFRAQKKRVLLICHWTPTCYYMWPRVASRPLSQNGTSQFPFLVCHTGVGNWHLADVEKHPFLLN